MPRNPRLARSLSILSALLCCNALVFDADAADTEDPNVALQVDGASVSADIRMAPLVEVARALARKTGVVIEFAESQAQNQVITAQFEQLDLDAALRAILQNTSYTMVARPSEQSIAIHVYVYARRPEDAAHSPAHGYPDPSEDAAPRSGASETEMAGHASDLALQSAETQPQDAAEAPPPPNEFHPDPTVRRRELEETVTARGPQSLALALAAAQDSDPGVQAASERLLLNDLRHAVPADALAAMALTSPRADSRRQALEALVLRQDPYQARMTLDSALRDPDEDVQHRARELLQALSPSAPVAAP